MPLDDAWNIWTTNEGVTSFFAPRANIEANIGGRYELFFDTKAAKGFQGTEGCRVLALERLKRLVFEFIAPPQFPNVRRVRSRVDLMFQEAFRGGLVQVDLMHSGFMEGEEWDECFDFFSWSWDLAFGRFQYRCSGRSVDWNNPYMPRLIAARPQRKLRDHVPS